MSVAPVSGFVNEACYVCNEDEGKQSLLICPERGKQKSHWSHEECQRGWAAQKRSEGRLDDQITCGQLGLGVCKTKLAYLLPPLPQKSYRERAADFFRTQPAAQILAVGVPLLALNGATVAIAGARVRVASKALDALQAGALGTVAALGAQAGVVIVTVATLARVAVEAEVRLVRGVAAVAALGTVALAGERGIVEGASGEALVAFAAAAVGLEAVVAGVAVEAVEAVQARGGGAFAQQAAFAAVGGLAAAGAALQVAVEVGLIKAALAAGITVAGAGLVAAVAGAAAGAAVEEAALNLELRDFIPAGLATAGLAGASVLLSGGGWLLAGSLACTSAVSTYYMAKRILFG